MSIMIIHGSPFNHMHDDCHDVHDHLLISSIRCAIGWCWGRHTLPVNESQGDSHNNHWYGEVIEHEAPTSCIGTSGCPVLVVCSQHTMGNLEHKFHSGKCSSGLHASQTAS